MIFENHVINVLQNHTRNYLGWQEKKEDWEPGDHFYF